MAIAAPSRISVALIVCATHLALIWLLLLALQLRRESSTSLPSETIVWTTVSARLPRIASSVPIVPQAAQPSSSGGRAKQRTRRSGAGTPTTTVVPIPSLSETPLPLATPFHERGNVALSPATDWNSLAHEAVLSSLSEAARRARQRGRIGSPTSTTNAAGNVAAEFPWSRRPLTSWFDVGLDNFELTLTFWRRCQVVLLGIIGNFGCALGPLDPSPGRSDLFDPRYRSQPLQLPISLLDQFAEADLDAHSESGPPIGPPNKADSAVVSSPALRAPPFRLPSTGFSLAPELADPLASPRTALPQ